MGVTPPNVATNRARKRSKVLRLVTLTFVGNFSVAPLGAILAMVTVSHKNPKQRRIRAWLIV
jgi:hypothetical protein